MPRRKFSTVVRIAILVAGAALASWHLPAQAPSHYTRKQLKLMRQNASNADDYQKLAAYIHYQTMLFHTKAQQVLDEVSRNSTRFPMATKTVSRAEVEKRSYDECNAKAAENAALAEEYDAKLIEMGVKPVLSSESVVSLKSLQSPVEGTPGSAFAPPKH